MAGRRRRTRAKTTILFPVATFSCDFGTSRHVQVRTMKRGSRKLRFSLTWFGSVRPHRRTRRRVPIDADARDCSPVDPVGSTDRSAIRRFIRPLFSSEPDDRKGDEWD